MRSLRSRPVAVAGTATVLQPTQPRSTVTRSHLRQAKGRSAGFARGRPAGSPSLPGSCHLSPMAGSPGLLLTPSPAAPRGSPLALRRGSSWQRPVPPQRSAAARRRAEEGAAAEEERALARRALRAAKGQAGVARGHAQPRDRYLGSSPAAWPRLPRRALRPATVLGGASGPALAPPRPRALSWMAKDSPTPFSGHAFL